MAHAIATSRVLSSRVAPVQSLRSSSRAVVAKRATSLKVVARDAPWLPGTSAPAYLDGSMPGDFGFDPLGFGANPEHLAKFREAELMHARWCMLAVTGQLGVEVLGLGNWIEAPLAMANGQDSMYLGNNLGPALVPTTLAAELLLVGILEGFRAGEKDQEKRMYPGGGLDPFGFSKGGDLDALKLKEIKNGRLAICAVFGNFMQGSVTHEGPVANWAAHIADPFNVNIATSNPVSIPYLHPELFSDNSAYWAAALPPWFPQ